MWEGKRCRYLARLERERKKRTRRASHVQKQEPWKTGRRTMTIATRRACGRLARLDGKNNEANNPNDERVSRAWHAC